MKTRTLPNQIYDAWPWLLLCLLGFRIMAEGLPDRDADATQAKKDEAYRRLVIGTWEDHYRGKRTMTIATNGTAKMVVELNGLTAMLYASRLEFNMVWSIEGGHLKKRTLDGKPAGKVKTILKMMGDRVDEPILELTHDRLLLLDGNGKRQYDWRRVP